MKLLASFIVFCFGAAQAEMVDYFTDNGFGNPLSTLQHPSGEYFEGVTYVAYQGPHEDPFVCAYSHDEDTWQGPFRAGVNPMGRHIEPMTPDAVDNHGRPAMIVDAAGYIHIVFGGHGGSWIHGFNTLGTWGRGRQIHVVSKRPRDITEWEVLDNISPFGTYSQFVKMDDGDIYLFFRHGAHHSDWVYQKSEDNGRSFSAPESILKHKAMDGNLFVHDTWYAWFGRGLGDTITASYIYHPCGFWFWHTKERYFCYFMQMDCTNGAWESVRGDVLSVPVTKAVADSKTMIWDSGLERSNRGTCRVDSEGNPHVFFQQDGQIKYYRWLGEHWQAPVVVTPDGGDGDLEVVSSQEVRMLVDENIGGDGAVCWWESRDGGLSWNRGACLLQLSGEGMTVGVLIRNGHTDARMVVNAENRAGSLYERLYLVGASGPVQRDLAGASNR